MSLAVAVPFGIASAMVYGTSIVVQHRMAQAHAGEDGQASASGLIEMARNPVWLMAIGGDFVGFLLQIVALSLGSVVVIQPLVVLMLPVALAVSALSGGYRPRRVDYLGVAGVLGGLAVFLVLIGRPGAGHVPRPHVIGMAVLAVVVLGAGLVLTVIGRSRICRGVMYGAVAGVYFGTLAVLVDAASDRFSRAGVHGLLATPRGIVPLVGIVLVGAGGIVLTQLSFQVGALGATLPANLATDPLTGVLLGVLLLRENVPISAWRAVVYALCLVVVVVGAIQLADPERGRGESHGPPRSAPAEAA